MRQVKVLNWNIGNPSLERARNQIAALARFEADILCLTETKTSAGCDFLKSQLQTLGYEVHAPTPVTGEYGTLLAAKQPMTHAPSLGPPGQEARAPAALLQDGTRIIGIYAPSNASTAEKLERKTNFLRHVGEQLSQLPAGPTLLLADLNTVATSHDPPVPFLAPTQTKWVDNLLASWTDALRDDAGPTWISWRGEAYRYDYCLTRGVEPRNGTRVQSLRGTGLSDHMGTTFAFDAPAGAQPRPQWRFA